MDMTLRHAGSGKEMAAPGKRKLTLWERKVLNQAEKQAAFDAQVASGQLVVRQMTADERRIWSARREAWAQAPRKRFAH
jgi:hypothetical protein